MKKTYALQDGSTIDARRSSEKSRKESDKEKTWKLSNGNIIISRPRRLRVEKRRRLRVEKRRRRRRPASSQAKASRKRGIAV